MSDFYRELWHRTEFGRRPSSVSTELEKKQVVKGSFEKILHHTEYGCRMSSPITELGKNRSVKKFEKNCITLIMAVARLLQLLN